MEINNSILEDLCTKYGDSFYLLDSEKFGKNYDELLEAFRNIYPNTIIGYSYKTNYTPRLCSIINNKGGYAEVVSEMEYDLAIEIGVPPQKIIVNGPYKNKQALEKFFLNGSIVNLDSYNEAIITEEIAKENSNAILATGFRCNFQIKDSFISRFGFDIESSDFLDSVNRLRSIPNISLKGFHCHFPDRNLESFKIRIEKMLDFISDSFKEELEYVDIGGGFFGKMNKDLEKQFNCVIPGYKEYADTIATKFSDFYKDTDETKRPKLIIEPGSALVADVMKFVTRVIDIKRIQNKDIAMTAGSKFNMGSFASTLNLPMTVYSNSGKDNNRNKFESIDISGYTCIENDYLYKDYKGYLSIGDFLAFDNVGSYSVVFKPPFILPNVPIIEYDMKTNNHTIIKRKEENDDIFRTYTF